MSEQFLDELPRRVQVARPNAAFEEYSLYVRLVRTCLGIDRARLAQQTGLDRSFLAFLENGLLRPDELTGEVRERIERTLGIKYDRFRASHQALLAELRQH
jgi:ribosome-binding protein aMBF1 (putative translation factor)